MLTEPSDSLFHKESVLLRELGVLDQLGGRLRCDAALVPLLLADHIVKRPVRNRFITLRYSTSYTATSSSSSADPDSIAEADCRPST